MSSLYESEPNENPSVTLQGKCPSCETVAGFRYIGVQEWPEALKRPATPLYVCGHCGSTMTGSSIEFTEPGTSARPKHDDHSATLITTRQAVSP
jgi:ribosomal protein L37AE/L43A